MADLENKRNNDNQNAILLNSFQEMKTQMNQMMLFIQNHFFETFQTRSQELQTNDVTIQQKMDEMLRLLQNQNSKKENLTAHHLSLIQKFEKLHLDLSNEENEIAQIYNDLLDYPILLNKIDVTRHHRILSKALALNPRGLNYEKFIKFVFESITKHHHPEFQSLLVYFDESDFCQFSHYIDELEKSPKYESSYLKYRDDRYWTLFDKSFDSEEEMKKIEEQQEELLKLVIDNQTNNKEMKKLIEELKSEHSNQMKSLETIINELHRTNSNLMNEIQQHEKQAKQEQFRIEEIEGRIFDELKSENCNLKLELSELKKQNLNLLSELEKHFNSFEAQLQSKNETTVERMTNEMKSIQRSIEPLSKFETHDRNQTTILTLIQEMNDYIPQSFSFVSNSQFNGILNFLKQKGGIQLKSGAPEYDGQHKVSNLIDYSNSNETWYFGYNTTDDKRWIEFDFLNRKIDLSSYQIKTYSGDERGLGNLSQPKEWKICGSNDQINWDPLDQRVNCSDLNAKSVTKHFVCQTPTHKHYRYIRYYQKKNWQSDTDRDIRISKFEFYGELYKS